MKKKIIGLFCFILICVNLFAGQIFYVTTTGNDLNDGKSWDTAFADVQTAIDAAYAVATDDSPSEVWIAAGTYKHGSQMTMKNNVEIYGGFAGNEVSKKERTSGNETIFDGENSYSIFYNNYTVDNPLTNSSKLDSVIIQNGKSDRGAGMYNFYASPEIKNCTFKNNNTPSRSIYWGEGGGMYNEYSNSILINCTFSSNGAMAYTEGSLYPPYVTVYSSGRGCAICNMSSKLTIINCTFIENIGLYSSGIFDDGSKSKFINCIIWNDGDHLSGFNCFFGSVIIDTCIIKEKIQHSVPSNITNLIKIDPKLMPLGSYDGSVQTCAVEVGSSAIGAGKVVEGITTDARGVIRSTTAPTIGAYEYVIPKIKNHSNTIYAAENQNVQIPIELENYTGKVVYQWQTLDINNEWVDIENAISATYTISNCQLEMTGSKYRCIVSNVADGASVTSEEIVLTVAPSVSKAELSVNRITIVDGGYGRLEVSSDAVEPTYKWYYSTNTGIDWIEIENSNSSVLEFKTSSSMNRYQYKCVVTDGGGTSVVSNKAVLIVNSNAIMISQDVGDAMGFIGKETVLSVSVTSSSSLGYQWQVSSDNGATWVDIKDATSSSLSLIPEDYELSGNLYRLKIDNGGGFVYSSVSTFTVFKNVEITEQPKDLIVWNAKNAEFEVSATGDGMIKYQWQILVGEEWRDIENAASAKLFLENVSTEMDGNKYRCVVSNEGTAVLYSNEATFTVYKTLEITSRPQETWAFAGDSATLTVEVDAQGDVEYRWQEFIGGEWVDLENAALSEYQIPSMEDSFDGRKFRVLITNGGDVFTSEEVSLKLATPVEITTQPQNIKLAYMGKMAVFSVEAVGYKPQYKWYVSGNYGTDEALEIDGATSNTLSISVDSDLVLENVYFCKITNDKSEKYSNLVYVEDIRTLSGYQSWAFDNGLNVDASASAISHGDGITNLEKYAFGLDASKATSYGANGNFKHSVESGVASFQFPVRKDASDISVKLMMSNDMSN